MNEAPPHVSRAPTDVLRLVVAGTLLLAAVVVAWLFDRTVVDHVANTVRGLDTVSATLLGVLASAAEIAALLLFGGSIAVALIRGQWRLVGAALAAAAVAVALVGVLDHIGDAETAVVDPDGAVTLIDPGRLLTAAGLAAAVALVTAAGPWVSRRWRRAGWFVVIVVAIVRFFTAPISFATLFALLAGWTAGAAVVVVFGAPSRRPTPEAIARGLGAVGVPLDDIAPLAVDARGSTPYLARATGGAKLFVKALGTDERSADLLFRVYRAVQPRDLGDERPFDSLRRMVEHEALVALTARELGVRTPRLVAFATAEPNGFVLSYEAIAGRSLDQLDPSEMTDEILDRTWAQLVILRQHRIAHRDLRLANIFLDDDGGVWIIDFGFAELSARDLLLANDVAELLASSSTRVGTARAIQAGMSAIGPDGLATALDRLKLPMLSGATRTAMGATPEALDELRHEVSLI